MKKIIIPIFMLLPLMTAQAQTVLTEEQQLEQAQKQLEAAKKALYTGHIGDGKIFVYNVDKVVKVRTGEEDFAALQDVE